MESMIVVVTPPYEKKGDNRPIGYFDLETISSPFHFVEAVSNVFRHDVPKVEWPGGRKKFFTSYEMFELIWPFYKDNSLPQFNLLIGGKSYHFEFMLKEDLQMYESGSIDGEGLELLNK